MTETEFLEASEALMQAIEDAVDRAGLDVECDRSGNVLTLEGNSGEQIVINRHGPTQQMWLATRKGGLHFENKDGRWLDTRTGVAFEEELQRALEFICGQSLSLHLGV